MRPTGNRRGGRAAALPPEERRRAIIDAVIPLLVEYGATVTTRQIAEAAGVAEGTIFGVFEDKTALLHAAAHVAMGPAAVRAELEAIDVGRGLHETVLAVAEHLLQRMEKVMAVMMAVRMATAGNDQQGPPGQGGPPAFMIEANRALLEALTAVFTRHVELAPPGERLAMEPARVALLVRSLVFGSRHPGMTSVELLTAEEIATALVSGIADLTPQPVGRR